MRLRPAKVVHFLAIPVAIPVAKFEAKGGEANQMMNAVWTMVVMFCPGYSDRAECRREIVPGVFPSEYVCKSRGELLMTKGVSYVCTIRWPNDA